MDNTVVGIYENLDNARRAVHELINRGFSMDKIDLSAKGEENIPENKESVGRFFSSLFGNTEQARAHTEAGYRGYVVTVHTLNRGEAERVADILDDYGAINPELTGRPGYTETDVDQTGYVGSSVTDAEATSVPTSEISIPVIEEEMQVGKREVETGRVRVRSRIIEKPVEEHLRLRTEHVEVERIPVNRAATAADLDQFIESEIEITEHTEEPVVNKEARVVEEIRVKKEVHEHEETMRGSVKRQDVEVDEKKRERNI